MPLPPGMATGTVVFDFERADGAPPVFGTLRLIPTSYRQELGVVVVPEPLSVAVTGGPQSTVVAATTDTWKYVVTEDLFEKKRRRYVIDVPAGGTADLSVVAHLDSPPVLGAVVRTVNGVGPDANGDVEVSGGGGGGGVASVTALDSTVTVGGTATNPKVGVNAVPESKVTGLTADLAARALVVRAINAGTGLLGGGDLSVDRTLAPDFGSGAGKVTQGNDARLSDARTPLPHSHAESDVTNLVNDLAAKIAAAIVDAKGDLIVGTANDVVARLAAGSGGQVLTADATQSAGLRYADPAYETFPLAADVLVSASAPLAAFRDHSTLGTAAWLALLRIPAGRTATKAWTAINTGGTVGAGGENSFGVYDASGTFLQQTATNNNQWTSAGAVGVLLPSPIVAPSSADLYVYLGVRVSGYSVGPDFAFLQSAANAALFDGAFGAGRKRSLTLGGSAWAGSINPNGTGGFGFLPFLAFS